MNQKLQVNKFGFITVKNYSHFYQVSEKPNDWIERYEQKCNFWPFRIVFNPFLPSGQAMRIFLKNTLRCKPIYYKTTCGKI